MDKTKHASSVVLGLLGLLAKTIVQCVARDAYQHLKALVCAWLGM